MSEKRRLSDERLGTDPIGALILRMGIPGLIAQMINLLYSLVDKMYIGHISGVGSAALTGLGITLPILQVISAFAALVGTGGAPLAAIALGKGDRERAERILGNGAVLLVCFSAVLTVVFMVFRRPLLYMVGASSDTYSYAEQYIMVYLAGTLFVQLTLGLNPFISAQGSSKTAMLSVIIGAVINIALDPLFIFVFGMGIQGAALATVIAQCASAVWAVSFLTRKTTALRIRRDRMKLRLSIIGGTMALGVSPFIMQSTESMVSTVLNSGLQHYGGDIYVASLTVIQSISSMIFVPMNGFINGVAPVISYNYGAGKYDRVKKTHWRLVILTVTVMYSLTTAAMLFPKFFAGIITGDEALIELVGRVLPMYLWGFYPMVGQVVSQNSFLALGQTRSSVFFALLRKIVLLIPLALILPRLTNSVYSIYIAEPISNTISATSCFVAFTLFAKKALSEQNRPRPRA